MATMESASADLVRQPPRIMGRALPPIDAAAPAKVDTATFGLG
jgi:hypothetical protein